MKQFIDYASTTVGSMLLGWAIFLGTLSLITGVNQFAEPSSMYSFNSLIFIGIVWAGYLTWKS